MHPLFRAVSGIAGLLLLGSGILFAVLGFWGISRRGNGAGWLAALGTSAALAGGALVLKAWRGTF
jgi:hypothetical protein